MRSQARRACSRARQRRSFLTTASPEAEAAPGAAQLARSRACAGQGASAPDLTVRSAAGAGCNSAGTTAGGGGAIEAAGGGGAVSAASAGAAVSGAGALAGSGMGGAVARDGNGAASAVSGAGAVVTRSGGAVLAVSADWVSSTTSNAGDGLSRSTGLASNPMPKSIVACRASEAHSTSPRRRPGGCA